MRRIKNQRLPSSFKCRLRLERVANSSFVSISSHAPCLFTLVLPFAQQSYGKGKTLHCDLIPSMTALSDGSDCLQLGQDESGQGLQTAPSNEIRLATVATAFSSGASQWQGPTSKFTLDQGTADDPDLSPPLSISASNVLRDTCAPGREYTPSLTATEVWSWPPSSRQSASSQKRAFPSGESGESSPGPKRRFGASLLEAPLTLDHRYLLCQVGALEGVRDLARGLSSRKPSTVVPSVDRRSCLRFRAPDPDAYAKSTSHRIMSEIQKAIRIANQALASPVNRDDCAHM